MCRRFSIVRLEAYQACQKTKDEPAFKKNNNKTVAKTPWLGFELFTSAYVSYQLSGKQLSQRGPVYALTYLLRRMYYIALYIRLKL
jgi:hypothetical protein